MKSLVIHWSAQAERDDSTTRHDHEQAVKGRGVLFLGEPSASGAVASAPSSAASLFVLEEPVALLGQEVFEVLLPSSGRGTRSGRQAGP